MSPKTLLPDFAVAVSQMAVEAATTAYPTDYIVEHILKLSNYLINLAGTCNLFGKPELDIYSPSLSTLHWTCMPSFLNLSDHLQLCNVTRSLIRLMVSFHACP